VAITVAVIGAVATITAAVISQRGCSSESPSAGGNEPSITLPTIGGGNASVFLNRDSGPGGSTVRVSGEGYSPNERVVIRFHTEQIGTTRTNKSGKFSDVAVTIPTSFSKFAPQQFDIIATGQSSLRTALAPFTISG
jgi:hypothetical protein